MSTLTLTAWANAWLGGHLGLDDVVETAERHGGPQTVGTAAARTDPGPGFEQDTPLRSSLARLRTQGLLALHLCLPVPGDPLGLVGHPELNMSAIEARAAVLLRFPERQVGLVPEEDRRGSSYLGVRWTPHPAADTAPPPVPLSEAEYELNQAIRECTPLFDGVDRVSEWGPEVTRALADLRDADRAPGAGLPSGYPPRAHRLAALADRLAVVVELAGEPAGAGISAWQNTAHATALRVLDRAVRRARLAAYGALAG